MMLWANVIASWMAQFRAGVPPLLLVIHSSAFEFLALRIGAAGSDGAALAVSRQDNATTSYRVRESLEEEDLMTS
jgi:hypothetical protein